MSWLDKYSFDKNLENYFIDDKNSEYDRLNDFNELYVYIDLFPSFVKENGIKCNINDFKSDKNNFFCNWFFNENVGVINSFKEFTNKNNELSCSHLENELNNDEMMKSDELERFDRVIEP